MRCTSAVVPFNEPEPEFEYRVMFRHYDGEVHEYGKGMSEDSARRFAQKITDREVWVERRPIAVGWERVS